MNNNELKIKKQEEYMAYIKEHRENVKKAFKFFIENNKIMQSTNREIQEAVLYLKNNNIIENHDNSKFSDEEFEPYRRYFYSINEIEKKSAEEDFNNAWKHHYEVNDHHPEHWIKDNVVTEMTMSAIIEMICDWEAMAYKFGGSAKEWYEKNKNNIPLHVNTRSKLEYLLNIYQ